MFMNDVNRKEEIRNIAIQHLKQYGIKYRSKKSRVPVQQVSRHGKKFFKVPLVNLETETVTLTNGQQLIIPKRVHEICSYVLTKVQTEGIFRREGLKSRQNEIKSSLDRGCPLGDGHNVIDVAVVLKSFLRELPEPLIPHAYNDLFLMCSLSKKTPKEILECILLACLLLPSENLNVLSYLMQFFYEVASFSVYNKMSFSNLSILVGPNIFPMDDKLAPKSSLTITRICDITKLLIENSRSIGFIPDNIIQQIGQLSDENEKRRKTKRRSGSLTRMLNGLKKIVSSKTEEEVTSYAVTPDLLLTPTIQPSIKKRLKSESGLSVKKKKDISTKLPDCALLNTPFTPSRTPISVNPNGKKPQDQDNTSDKEKKMHWYMRSRSMKSLKEEDSITSSSTTTTDTRGNSSAPKSLLERRWSAVSNVANFRKKKRISCAATKKELAMATRNNKPEDADYVRVPKIEYEDFKSRVTAIERRISMELDSVQNHMDNDNNVNKEIAHEKDNNIQNVQTAYQMTLETSSLSPTTDQLAKRLSRDLRIRRSSEQKIIRSPSARKIGTIRRRSTEREKKNSQINRNQSWHLGTSTAPLLPRVSTRRKRPLNKDEAIISQMNLQPEVTPPRKLPTNNETNLQRSVSFPKSNKRKTLNTLSRIDCTFNLAKANIHQSSPTIDSMASRSSHCHTSGESSEHWVSAENFFAGCKTPLEEEVSVNARASIAKLRSQNVGMVLAKARLFDNLKDSDTSCSSNRSQPSSAKKTPKSAKNTSLTPRSSNSARMSYRIKALRAEKRSNKKSSSHSPRRKQAIQKQRLQNIGRQLVRSNNFSDSSMEISDSNTPCRNIRMSPKKTTHVNVPYIKMPLVVKTPKRLCRTPGVDKKTPFRVMATPL
ncbi:unnamed protein product [Ceutorhynchus assimilis]|uniref:Rho-GAP domain-containing protein n=1 Tax=Ceutorhynchus assimilis TaxID=467358 RepID=A0A9N9QM56_9CUCU|nr:unnamed protein product [Ceutorhynchus assimilis]